MEPFKVSYNTHNDKWSINELLIMCVQEEGRLIMELGESTLLATQVKNHNQVKPKEKAKLTIQGEIKKEFRCRFCKKK